MCESSEGSVAFYKRLAGFYMYMTDAIEAIIEGALDPSFSSHAIP